MKKKYLIILVCFIAVVLFAALYVFVMYDSDKSKPSPTPTPTPTPTPSPSSSPTYPPIISDMSTNFSLQDFPLKTDNYIYGVLTNRIDINKKNYYTSTSYDDTIINTMLVDDKRVICGISQGINDCQFSEDTTKMIFLSGDEEELCPNLVMYNAQTDSFQKISSDIIGGYDSQYYRRISGHEEIAIHWISNPLLSEDNLLVAYNSDRRTYEDFKNQWLNNNYPQGTKIERTNDIWINNIESGEDYLLVENATLYCFVGRTLIYTQYLSGTEKIYSINIDTNEVTQLPSQYIITGANKSSEIKGKYIYNNLENEDMNCYDIVSKSYVNFSITQDDFAVVGKQIVKSDDGIYYAAIKYKDNNGLLYLGLNNLATGEKKICSVFIDEVAFIPFIIEIIDNSKIITSQDISPKYQTDSEFFLIELKEFTR